MKREDDEIFSRGNLAILTTILAVAAAVRLVGLDWASVWEDEVTYMDLVRTEGPLALLRELPKRDAGGSPLYLLLLQAWLSVVGDSIVAARIPSAVCGTLAVALVYAIGRRFFDARTGLCAAWLAALNPLDVYHSREVRVYPWLVLLACAGWYILESFRRSAPVAKQVAFALVLIALLYSHPLGGFMVAALGVGYLILRLETRLRWRNWIVINVATAAAFAPWVTRHLDHAPQVLLERWTAWVLLEWPEGFTGGRAELVTLCAALILLGLIGWKNQSTRLRLEAGAKVSLAWFLIPTLLLIASSLVSYRIFGPRRYLLFVGPAYLLLVARGISVLPRRVLQFAAMAILTVMASSAMVRRSFATDRADWKGAASLIGRQDPRAPVIVMDEENHVAHRACLGIYLAAGQQPIPARREVTVLATSRPETLWFVVETAPRNTALPIPDELTRLYVAEHSWTLKGVTLIQAHRRLPKIVDRSDASVFRLR
ncbi:MAG: glycosyltransferase family 39 protein [Isosphaeraceae bacterium]